MKNLPYTFPAIEARAAAYREAARLRVIASRRKFVSGVMPIQNWLALCDAARVRLIMASRAFDMSDSACGWIIAQSFNPRFQ